MSKLASEINALVNGYRETPASLTEAERLLLLKLRQAGFDLVADVVQGPRGSYLHRRVIRRKGAA